MFNIRDVVRAIYIGLPPIAGAEEDTSKFTTVLGVWLIGWVQLIMSTIFPLLILLFSQYNVQVQIENTLITFHDFWLLENRNQSSSITVSTSFPFIWGAFLTGEQRVQASIPHALVSWRPLLRRGRTLPCSRFQHQVFLWASSSSESQLPLRMLLTATWIPPLWPDVCRKQRTRVGVSIPTLIGEDLF